MKKLTILSAIVLGGLIFNTANAQIGIHVGFHFGTPMVYAPQRVVVEQAPVYEQTEPVYDEGDNDYYYLPDVGAYYNVNEQCYYYNNGDSWTSAAYLPGEYRNYNWRDARRYEVRAARPYLRDDFYRSRYHGHAGGEWEHGNNGLNGNYNREENYNRGYRGDSQRFDNREHNSYQHHFDNRNEDSYNRYSERNNDHNRENRWNNGRQNNIQFHGSNVNSRFN